MICEFSSFLVLGLLSHRFSDFSMALRNRLIGGTYHIYGGPMFQGECPRKIWPTHMVLIYQAILGSRSIPIEEMDIEFLAVNTGISTEDQRFKMISVVIMWISAATKRRISANQRISAIK